MRLLMLLVLMLIANTVSIAQNTDTVEEYYDYHWKKCLPQIASYYRLAYKDGKWWYAKDYHLSTQTIQMKGWYSEYEKGEFRKEQGMFFYYHPNGKVSEKVRYIDGVMEGVLKKFDTNGVMTDSAFFKKGIPVKVAYRWKDKKLIFKGVYDEKGSGIGEEWAYYENGILSDYWKLCAPNILDSVSLHYYPNGKLSCKEYYMCGKVLKRDCYDTSGIFIGNECKDSEPIIAKRELRKALQKIKDRIYYAAPKEIKELRGKVNSFLIVKVCVDEKGVLSITLTKGINPILDSFITHLFQEFPNAKPAIVYNRNVYVCEEEVVPIKF